MKKILFILLYIPCFCFSQTEIAQGFSNYDGFPYPVIKSDKIYFFWKSSATHGAEGKFMIARSSDGGKSTDSTWQMPLALIDSVSNFSIGVSNTSRIVVAVKNTASGNAEQFAYTDDMITWTAGTKYSFSNTGTPFGRIKATDNGLLLATYYETGGAVNATYLLSSSDGIDWNFYDTLAYQQGQTYNEADITYLGNSRLIATVRQETANRPSQWTSTDNGHTWIRRGGLNGLQFSVNGSPCFTEYFKGKLWVFGSYRAGDGDHSVWWYSNATVSQVFSDTSKWAKRSAYYHPLNDDLGNATIGIDNGYTIPFQFGGELYTCGYDNTPLQTSTATAKIRAFTIKISGKGDFCKVYNVANQSISSGVNTSVQFLQVDLNDGFVFNTDSGFVVIKQDGFYSIDTNATFDTSSGGTKRKMYIYLTAAVYNAAASKQAQLLSQDTKRGGIDTDFNRLECHVTNVRLRKGEQIKVYVYQDTGDALNLMNTVPNMMASLKLKRYND